MRRLLMQNVVVGCTCLLNRPLANLAARMPPEAHMHDWWTALLACAFGASVWLEEQTVLYRQHGANVFGASRAPVPAAGLPDRANAAPRAAQWGTIVRQAEALLRLPLRPGDRTLCEAVLRSETSPSRLVRVATLLRYGLRLATPRQTAAILLHLWDKR
jgi:hypothetical protein